MPIILFTDTNTTAITHHMWDVTYDVQDLPFNLFALRAGTRQRDADMCRIKLKNRLRSLEEGHPDVCALSIASFGSRLRSSPRTAVSLNSSTCYECYVD